MPPTLRCPSITSASACASKFHKAPLSRSFSSTAHNEQRITRARQQMFRWLNSQGDTLRNPAEDSTNYVAALQRSNDDLDNRFNQTPFPLNRNFVSQPMLSDDLREDIWKRIMQDGQSVRDVSAALGVEMRRVAAVVRLKEVEKEWLRIVSSRTALDCISTRYVMISKKNRLVFKTTIWLQTLACEPL